MHFNGVIDFISNKAKNEVKRKVELGANLAQVYSDYSLWFLQSNLISVHEEYILQTVYKLWHCQCSHFSCYATHYKPKFMP